MSPEQQAFLSDVIAKTGLVLDPVYTGKALYGLAHLEPRPRVVLFIHTGGLPGALAAMMSG
jgi:D-cysteine desulfhydrase